jgi:hypothetical protein
MLIPAGAWFTGCLKGRVMGALFSASCEAASPSYFELA